MRKKRLLLVEPDPRASKYLRSEFERRGYLVTTSADGKAFPGLAGQRAHLIVLDSAILNRDGSSVLRDLKQRYRGARIVLIGFEPGLGRIAEAYRIGISDAFQSPLSDEDFATIEQIGRGRPFRTRILPVHREQVEFAEPVEPYDYLIDQSQDALDGGDCLLAKRYAVRALECEPERPDAYYQLARVYEIYREIGRALNLHRAALSLSPTFRPSQDAIRSLTEMHL